MISLGEFILLSLIVVLAVLATVYLNRKLKEKGYRVNNLLNVLAVLAVSTALCLVGTSVAWILKGVAFALILLYASVEDLTKREADDCLWVMILLLCITNASGLSLWSMLGGGIIAFVPTLTTVISSLVMIMQPTPPMYRLSIVQSIQLRLFARYLL